MTRALATLLILGPGLRAAPPAASTDAFARSLSWLADLPAGQATPANKPSPSPAILQLRVIDGEDVVYGLGSRATRGLTVQVTDETGQPVEGAAVSFRLPDDGATGTFENGSKSEVAVTKADGRASVWGMRWNKTAGPVSVRITALKEPARAGAMTQVYLSPQVAADQAESKAPAYRSGKKWITILLVAAGIAGGGLIAGVAAGKVSAPPASIASTAPRIGTPSIILGKP